MLHRGSWDANISIAEIFRLDYSLHARIYRWATSLKQSTSSKTAMGKKKVVKLKKTDKI